MGSCGDPGVNTWSPVTLSGVPADWDAGTEITLHSTLDGDVHFRIWAVDHATNRVWVERIPEKPINMRAVWTVVIVWGVIAVFGMVGLTLLILYR